jgi:excisionase family DNA binding protein
MSAEHLLAGLASLADVPGALASVERRLARIEEKLEALRLSQPPTLVTPQEAAIHLGVSLSTVRRGIRDGSIPSRRVGHRSVRVDLGALRPPTSHQAAAAAFTLRKNL